MYKSHLAARFMIAGLVCLAIGMFSGCKAISFVKLKYMGEQTTAHVSGYRKYMRGRRQNIESTTQRYVLYTWDAPDKDGNTKRHESYDLVPINWQAPADNRVEIYYRLSDNTMRQSVTPSRLVENSQDGLAYSMAITLILGVGLFAIGTVIGKTDD